MESQELKEFYLCIVFRKIKLQYFEKMQNTQFWGLFSQCEKKLLFHKNHTMSLFSTYIPLTSCKQSEKNWASSEKNSN